MTNSKQVNIKVIKKIFDFLSKCSQEDLDMLAKGDAKLTLSTTSTRKSVNKSKDFNIFVENDLIVKNLYKVASRKAAYELLDEAKLTKAELEDLARYIDIPVSQRDNISRIKERIVENTVGHRLRSEAIQGQYWEEK